MCNLYNIKNSFNNLPVALHPYAFAVLCDIPYRTESLSVVMNTSNNFLSYPCQHYDALIWRAYCFLLSFLPQIIIAAEKIILYTSLGQELTF